MEKFTNQNPSPEDKKAIVEMVKAGPREIDIPIKLNSWIPFGGVASDGEKTVCIVVPMPGAGIDGQKIWMEMSIKSAIDMLTDLQSIIFAALGHPNNKRVEVDMQVINTPNNKALEKIFNDNSKKKDHYLDLAKKLKPKGMND